mmetsp:Transcript_26350/g.39921  ORF Transcript_26350/g.39921 Transcript_26350/m.39921 type:complete len:206 (-) Transcript_26350:63-680(-)|eukprot:CAMPEP_0178926496 /NCGR_PEP_ID=MMETSP0786-20121207/18571_1 /TAXON_ID=186022 /ORGANISM="Thalassionema frauenfeldii, Strain CCMP 1798" /LENGTH=205 /DNA_ID=CAMNT_0020601637 /DNA_START=120 /DNA_END=737 /DNA_ORIENTATION=+
MKQSFDNVSTSCAAIMNRSRTGKQLDELHEQEQFLDKENLKVKLSNLGRQNCQQIASLLHVSSNNTHRTTALTTSSTSLREHLEQISLTPQQKRLIEAPEAIYAKHGKTVAAAITPNIRCDVSDIDCVSSIQSFQQVPWGQQNSEHQRCAKGLRESANSDPVASKLLQEVDEDYPTPALSDNLQDLFHHDELIRPKATKGFVADE